VVLPRGTVHLLRTKFLWRAVCYESLRFRNYGMDPVEFAFSLRFDADFADIFEVRGMRRERRGRRLDPQVEDDRVVLAYEGLDGVTRRTTIRAAPRPAELTGSAMEYRARLGAQQEMQVLLTIACDTDYVPARVVEAERALEQAAGELERLRLGGCHIYTANEQFNEWLNRSQADLHMMVTQGPDIVYPYAGVPWFSTVFGRDGILTAFEYLWVNPEIARGVLSYLALRQATDLIPEQDAEPGKILHEQRAGEMASLGEHPFLRYYGSIDATPLFVMLAGAYYRRTNDTELVRSIWPNIEKALEWIDFYGDRDRDGFVEYARVSEKGLVQQGWKDSQDSVFHADGRLADPPIALCEVQGYVYAARVAAAELASLLGLEQRAEKLRRQAEVLRQRFERAFWDEELSTYALALDGAKRPCRVRSSNPGHCLAAGIASPEHGSAVAAGLLSPEMFSGWGIRTLAANEARYNPMSYHNGSVWPHDNAIAAYGLARYGFQEQAGRIMSGLFDAALFVDQRRLPELFCGFPRRASQGPTLYPVACSPQAWAAGAVFLLLQAGLGMTLDAPARQIRFDRARLPEFLPEVTLRNLRVGEASVDLALGRHNENVTVSVLRREGDVEVWSVK
jgi:glycogen debranching enzyme